MTATFERIVTSTALNKTAALVTRRGVHWNPEMTSDWVDVPLPVGARCDQPQAIKPGERYGRLTVLGYAVSRPKPAVYVVRCACGLYGHRRAKALRGDNPRARMCPACDYLEQMKLGQKPAPDERAELRVAREERKRAVRAMSQEASSATLGDVWPDGKP